jgi:hypothetical protein
VFLEDLIHKQTTKSTSTQDSDPMFLEDLINQRCGGWGRPGRCVDDCDGVVVGEKVGGEVGGGMTSRITRWREAGARRRRGGGMQRARWTIFFCERWTRGMVVRGRAECERGDGPTCRRGRMVLPAEQRNHVQWRCPYRFFRVEKQTLHKTKAQCCRVAGSSCNLLLAIKLRFLFSSQQSGHAMLCSVK